MSEKLIGYTRVSKENLSGKGVSLDEQSEWLISEANRRKATLEIVSEGEGVSGKKLSNRPVLNETLRRLDKGEATGLVVKKLDRLSRSVADFLYLLERSRKGKWSLIIGDLDIDTSTPLGEAMATVSATFAQLERAKIAERTRDALAHKKAQGVRLGRPLALPENTAVMINHLRLEGLTLTAIAEEFNSRGVPTAHGGSRWYPSTIKKVLDRSETIRERLSA
jgi:DNA invertase Pin-like site-specific DNA recombinase